MISTINPSQIATAAEKPSGSAPFSSGSDFTMFLKMLTTQMQNQNPLNPVEAADFAVQLATFSGVEQQVQTNQLLARLTERSISGDLAAWLGADVAAGSTTVVGQSDIHLHLPTATAGATRRDVVFRTPAGQEVLRLGVSTSQTSAWIDPKADGASPVLPGSYVTEVEDFANGDLLTKMAAPHFARVEEVQKTPSGAVLVLDTGTSIDPIAVIAIRKPRT
jgi:flagellar basal-body rod modification protein FlgD